MRITFIILGSLLVFILLDVIFSTSTFFNATVVDKQYKSEYNAIGTGVISKGNAVITSHYSPEEFLLIVKYNERIITVTCTPELYHKKQINSPIECRSELGRFTGWNWGNYGNQ